MERLLLFLTLGAYGVAIYDQVRLLHKEEMARRAAFSTYLAFSLQTLALLARMIAERGFPGGTLYGWILFFTWLAATLYLIGQKGAFRNGGIFLLPILASFLLVAVLLPEKAAARPSPEGLWLWVHLSAITLSYAAMTFAALTALMYMHEEQSLRWKIFGAFYRRFPPLATLDVWTRRALLFGWITLTAGMVAGSLWAKIVWGSFWNWNPKEVWTLLDWGLFSMALGGWGYLTGRKKVFLVLVAYAVALLNVFGVDLLSGPHRYF